MAPTIKLFDLSKQKANKFTWKKILDNYPHHDLSIDDFVEIAAVSDGLHVVGPGRAYSIRENHDNVDQWVKEALWHHDSEYYESLRGWTKSARTTRATVSLLKYCGKVVYKKQLFDDEFESIYNRNLDKWRDSFKNVNILDVDKATTKVPTDGAAGYNFPGKKKGEVLPQAAKYVRKAINIFKEGRSLEQIPYKFGLRGHLSPENENKSRVVWMGAVETAVMENMLFRGFYDQIFSAHQFKNEVMTGIGSMHRLHEFLGDDSGYTFLNTDVSGWDSMRCRFLLRDVFSRVLRPNINFENDWEERMFEHLEHDFIFSTLALPNGVIIQKDSGVPSGSFLTLLINSIANSIFVTSLLEYLGVQFYHKKVLGDDFGCYLQRMEESQFDDFIFDISAASMSFFGMTMKPEKIILTNVVGDRKFIGYQVRGGRIFREDEELFKGILYPESEVKSLGVSFTRVFAFFVIGGSASERFTKFYERYLGGFMDSLKQYGDELFRADVMRSGNLRVFKHLYHFDLDILRDFNVETFRGLFSSKIPFALTLGLGFVTGF